MAIFADLFGAQQEMLPIAFANLKTTSWLLLGYFRAYIYRCLLFVSARLSRSRVNQCVDRLVRGHWLLWLLVVHSQEPVSPSSTPCVRLDSIADAGYWLDTKGTA